MPLLSVVIPVYNEAATIARVIARVETCVLPTGFDREIIIVNDGSTDGTRDILANYEASHTVVHKENSGKGGACRIGFGLAKGDYIVVQDADLEQNPSDFSSLLAPLLSESADVVFGSRFMGTYRPASSLMSVHYLINRAFTATVNFATGYHTSDVWTGYKMYSRTALDSILPLLRSNGVEFELEIAVLLGKRKLRVSDVPISYNPRWYGEGKKTNWKHGVKSIGKLITFKLRSIPS